MIDARARIVLVVGALAIGFILRLPPETAKQLAVENGPVENASLVLLAASVILSARQLALSRSRQWLSATLVTLALPLRELDVHRLFGPRSIDSTGFHRSAATPLSTKLLVTALAAPFLLAGLHLCGIGARRRRRHPGSTGLDRPRRSRARDGRGGAHRGEIRPGPPHVIEEGVEVMFAVFVLLLVLGALRGAAPESPG